jgi:cytochrome c oxidase assembly protein subunit 15
VLELPARIAIQFAHRLGAVVITLLLLAAGLRALRRPGTARAGALLLGALGLQLLVGSLMVIRGFPLWLATAHNAGAALLLLATLNFLLASRAAASSDPSRG